MFGTPSTMDTSNSSHLLLEGPVDHSRQLEYGSQQEDDHMETSFGDRRIRRLRWEDAEGRRYEAMEAEIREGIHPNALKCWEM